MSDWINDLERLRALREDGHISEAEFQAAKARVLGCEAEPARATSGPELVAAPEPPSLAKPEPDLQRDYYAQEEHRPPLLKRILLGTAIIAPVLFAVTWGIGRLDSPLSADGISSSMAANCVGVGAAGTTERTFGQPVSVFIDGLKQQGIKPLNIEAAGDEQFVLRVEEDDPAKKVRGQGAYYMRRISGNGGLAGCGPDTLSVERVLADDNDLGPAGFQAVLFTIMRGMQARGIKPPAVAARVTSERVTNSPATNLLTGSSTSEVTPAQSSDSLTDEELAETRGPVHLIVGSWVPEGEYCASGAGLQFRPGGRWETEGNGGSWRFEADTLSLREKSGKLSEAATTWVNGDDFTAKWQDGTRSHWRRCPSDGSREPWFPAQS